MERREARGTTGRRGARALGVVLVIVVVLAIPSVGVPAGHRPAAPGADHPTARGLAISQPPTPPVQPAPPVFRSHPYPSGSGSTVVPGASLLANPYVGSLTNRSIYALPRSIAAYDPTLGELYVPLYGFDEVAIVSDQNNSLVAIVNVQADPAWATYDPSDGYVYVTNFQNNSISVIDGRTVIANLSLPNGARMSVYDPANGDIYAVDQGLGGPYTGPQDVSVVHGTSIVTNVTLAPQLTPDYATYAPNTQDLYVCDAGSANVSVLDGTTFLANVTVGTTPVFGLYDPDNGYVYVTNSGSSNVSVLSGTSVVATIDRGGGPGFSAYDPENGYVYVPNPSSDNVSVINGTRVVATIPVAGNPTYATFDPQFGQVYVSDVANDTVSVLRGTSAVAVVSVGNLPLIGTYDSGTHDIYLPDEGSGNLSVIGEPSQPYPVTFSEQGLPASANFSVQLGATLYTPSTPTVVASEPNGTFHYDVTPVPGYYAENGTGDVVVNGTGAWVNVTFVPAYLVTFLESGLPIATPWSVRVGPTTVNSTSDNLTFWEPNGSFAYSVGVVQGYRLANETGAFVVDGLPVDLSLPFAVSEFPVVFREVGLPNGQPWQVFLANLTKTQATTHIDFLEPNGTYGYRILAGPGYFTANFTGPLTVSGFTVEVNRTFVPAYPVVFREHGLPQGTNWSVTIGETANSSTTATIVVSLPDGTQTYTVGPVPGYLTTWTGTVEVAGASQLVNVSFTRTVYPVDFAEVGLPTGTAWSVLLNGTLGSSSGPVVSFSAPNGTLPYSIGRVPGWVATERAAAVEVDAAAVLVNVTFVRTYPVTFRESGLSNGTPWNVTIGLDSNSSTSATIVLDEPNGTHDYLLGRVPGYTVTASGTVVVSAGPSTVLARFAAVLYTITFHETGLPYLGYWDVRIGAALNHSTGATVGIEEPNGTYTYQVGGAQGSRPSVAAGRVDVNGSGPTIEVVFAATTYTVTVEEEGLPTGTPWSVTLAGSVQRSTSTSVTVLLGNGTYNYTVDPVAGYDTPAPGTFTVLAGSPPPLVLVFTGSGSGGPTAFEELAVGAGLLVVVAAVVAVLLARRRRSRPTPPGPPDEPPTP